MAKSKKLRRNQMSSFISHLEWRHATKGFDPKKKVSDDDAKKILDTIRLSPSSFGLQPFHVEVVTDQALKEKLQPHAWHQKQIITCSHLLVFVAHNNMETRIDDYFNLATGGNADARGALKDYEGMMRGFFTQKSAEQKTHWAQNQTYLALGFALAACAELAIDSCPMEGFMPEEFRKLLNLKPNEFASVLLAVGYRDPEIQLRPKVRFSDKELFHRK
jgi:nitroreductase